MRLSGWMAAAVLLGGSAWMGAQTSSTTRDDLFAGTEKFAANASSVTEVDMDPDSLDMVGGHNSTRARRTVLSVVHTYTYDKPGMYNMADVDAFRNKLNTGDWHCSVHVRELKSGESTDVCRKHRGDDLEESAIITVEPKELTFIHTIRRPSTPSTPGTPGKPGGDSFLVFPSSFESPLSEGMPAWAWGAEMRANAAEMRAQGAVQRAEMAALRPQMIAGMAEMRADIARTMPSFRRDLFPDGDLPEGYPLAEELRLQGLKLTTELPGLDNPFFTPQTRRQRGKPGDAPVAPATPATPESPKK